jgi:ABC-type nickel/cobalt efflux system permease component RcnA
VKKLLFVLAVVTALAIPAGAAAHPLGNFTTNGYSEVTVSGGHAYVLYVLDLAEIPTYQARGEVERLGSERYGRSLVERITRGVTLTADGAALPLRPLDSSLTFPKGVAGLSTTRLEVVLDGGAIGRAARLAFADRAFAGRLGWHEVVIRADDGASILSSSVPARGVSNRLRSYPQNLLESPLDVTRATARIDPGEGRGTPPAVGETATATKGEDGFAALIEKQDLSVGIVLVSLLAALFWGAAHALTPGHGKAIVAAYMVGTRGTARHAALLGLTVTITHTLGVFLLGLVTLGLSEFIVPEDLYPWLNLVSALLVVAVGVTVLRYRILGWIRGGRPHHRDHHHHDHDHDHHGHGHHHHHGPGGHTHVPEPGSGLRGLIAVGVSGGLLPCPTALVVLLAAISLHRVAYGLVLIVAFSLGLAAVITAIGLLAVTAKRTFGRMSFEGRFVRALPAVSALVIIGLGVAMTVRALPTIN